jgi:hypothetical protein
MPDTVKLTALLATVIATLKPDTSPFQAAPPRKSSPR